MNKILLYAGIYIFGVVISAFAQILLKKSADIIRSSKIKEYLNFKTIIAYIIFGIATICSLFAYKYLPLSIGTVLGTTEYIFVALLSYFLLNEKISRRKLVGLIVIVLGVLIFSI